MPFDNYKARLRGIAYKIEANAGCTVIVAGNHHHNTALLQALKYASCAELDRINHLLKSIGTRLISLRQKDGREKVEAAAAPNDIAWWLAAIDRPDALDFEMDPDQSYFQFIRDIINGEWMFIITKAGEVFAYGHRLKEMMSGKSVYAEGHSAKALLHFLAVHAAEQGHELPLPAF